SLLPAGPRPRRGAGHAPAPGPRPPRAGHPVHRDRSAGAGPYRAVDGYRDVPRHGHDLLAAPGRGGIGAGGGALMDYDAIVTQALTPLQREQRFAYRVLKLRLQIDDDLLEALKDDLIYAKKLAVDEDGRVLVWTGGTSSAPPTASPVPLPPTPEIL